MDDKEQLAAIVKLCPDKGVYPCRLTWEIYNLDKATVSTKESLKEEKSLYGKLIAEGMHDGRLGSYECECEDLSKVDIDDLTAHIIEAAKTGREYKAEYFANTGFRLGKSESYSSKLMTVPEGRMGQAAQKIFDIVSKGDSRFQAVEVESEHWNGRVTLASTENLSMQFKRNGIHLTATIHADLKGEELVHEHKQSIHRSLDNLDENAFASEAVKAVQAKLDAVPCGNIVDLPGIFAPAVGGFLLHIATTLLAGDVIAAGKSPFSDKVGQDVFSEKLTFLNDPFIASDKARPFDEAGNPTEKFMAVDHGRLRVLFLDKEYGAKLGAKPNGCYTRKGCRCQYIVAQPSEIFLKALLADTGDCLIVNELIDIDKGGLNKQTLDFDCGFYGYLVKDGKTTPVYGKLEGNALKFVRSIVEASKERRDTPYGLIPWFKIAKISAR